MVAKKGKKVKMTNWVSITCPYCGWGSTIMTDRKGVWYEYRVHTHECKKRPKHLKPLNPFK